MAHQGPERELEMVRELDYPHVIEVPPLAEPGGRGKGRGVGDPQRILSFLDRLRAAVRAEVDLESREAALWVPRNELVAFCLAHDVEANEARALVAGDTSYEQVLSKGFLQKLWLYFREFQPGVPIGSIGQPLPIAELHRPDVRACKAGYRVTSAREREVGIEVKVRGVKAGGGLKTIIKTEDYIWIDGQCAQVVVPADIVTVQWRHPDTGKVIEVVDVLNLGTSLGFRALPPDRLHLCGMDYDKALDTCHTHQRQGIWRADVDFRKHSLRVSGGLESKRQTESSRSFRIQVPALGVEIESQFTRGFEYSYELTGGTDYLGFFEEVESEVFFWAWDPRSA